MHENLFAYGIVMPELVFGFVCLEFDNTGDGAGEGWKVYWAGSTAG